MTIVCVDEAQLPTCIVGLRWASLPSFVKTTREPLIFPFSILQLLKIEKGGTLEGTKKYKGTSAHAKLS